MIERIHAFVLLLFFVRIAYGTNETIIYVSSTSGSERYDGLDADHPMMNLQKALESGGVVLLKAGDYFYVGGLNINGKVLSRYGEGCNPTICGFKRIVEP